jgi:hypothetical protein
VVSFKSLQLCSRRNSPLHPLYKLVHPSTYPSTHPSVHPSIYLTYLQSNYVELSPFREVISLCSYTRTSQHFMEPEGSLPHSQESSIGPHPEIDQSSPFQPHLNSPRLILILRVFTHLRLGLASGLLPSNNIYAFLLYHVRATCPDHISWNTFFIFSLIYLIRK